MIRIGPPQSLADLLAWHTQKRDTAQKNLDTCVRTAEDWEAKHGKRCRYARRMETQHKSIVGWHQSAMNVIQRAMP